MIPKTKLNDELFEAILRLKDLDDCYKFFDDLCTIKEVESMAQRIAAAKLLLENNTYEEVIAKTTISSATLSRVSKCIKYGAGGYRKILSSDNQK
jgi:TrpR-related protein YerC/YecD